MSIAHSAHMPTIAPVPVPRVFPIPAYHPTCHITYGCLLVGSRMPVIHRGITWTESHLREENPNHSRKPHQCFCGLHERAIFPEAPGDVKD